METVHRLLPVLCDPLYGLTPAQVVGIASNIGGKQALETVQRLLPELCKPPYGLTPAQVVGIASNGGGKQALEGVVAQLSTPHPALAAFTNDRLVALACLGGRPALEAVKNGLPRTVALIRKMNKRVPERTAHHGAELGKILRLLSFFQGHSNPTHAFHEATAEFEM
ncbi:avirulence protein, partial [Xanthomonas theicola]